MKLAHNIRITVFEDENTSPVESGLKKLIPFDYNRDLIIQKATGFDERLIRIYTVTFENNSKINKILKNLFENITKQDQRKLLDQMDSRIDENLNFFIRLDKNELLQGNYKITDSGDCFHIKIKIASFPKSKDKAKSIISSVLDSPD